MSECIMIHHMYQMHVEMWNIHNQLLTAYVLLFGDTHAYLDLNIRH